MDEREITEANRRAWNEVTPRHQKSRTVNLAEMFREPGYSTLDETVTAKLKAIGLTGKAVAQPCCNNGRELLSLLNLGAREGVGFDISDTAIAEARALTRNAGLPASFVRTDVLEIDPNYRQRFDLVFISIGALTWLPDLDRFFAGVAGMLKPGGDLLVYEMHPFLYMFGTDDDEGFDADRPLQVMFSYFRTEPWSDTSGLDYVGHTKYEASPSYSFTQKFSDILNPIIRHGLSLRELQEFDHDTSVVFGHLERFRLLPLSYLLHARKP